MKRKYTIKVKDEAGNETERSYDCKNRALFFCDEIRSLKMTLEVELTVEIGKFKKSERFICEA